MKTYPKIPGQIRKDMPYYVFDKLDGSNIRAEWSKKRGFHKFGTRKQMMDESYPHPFLGESIPLIQDKYEDDIARILTKNKIERATFFFEFYGETSFAGYHYEEDHTVTLIDANLYKVGFIPPSEYMKLFGDLDIAELLHHGNINQPLIDQIRDGTLPGMTFEGVVCKGKAKKGKRPIMFKIKNQEWYNKLRLRCKGNEELFEELA
jgi:hypothetical protein